MICPKTTFDCISCDTECMLVKRQEKGDPFRRGNELRTCYAGQEILDDSDRAIAHEFSQR